VGELLRHAYVNSQMKDELKNLLDRLEDIANEHEELFDTDVREQMYEAVYHGFIVQTPGYTLPNSFGVFEPAGNAKVRAALAEFIAAAKQSGPGSSEERFADFQDGTVLSKKGNPYDEFFGHANSFQQLSAAIARPAQTAPVPAKKWWQFWK
jgi:hypothetical protein